MNILYISYDGLSDPLGQSQIIPYMKGVAAAGFQVTILSAEKKDQLNQQGLQIFRDLTENNINWFHIPYTYRPAVLSTLIDLLRMRRMVKKLHRQKNFDIVHCRSYLPATIGYRMKKHYGLKFIFDMRGFWADERVDGKIWKLQNPLYRFIYRYFKKYEKKFLQTADLILSLTEAGKREIITWPILKNRQFDVQVIPCCADAALFDPKKINSTRIKEKKEALGLDEKDFVMSYLGSIGTWYLLDEMLDFFQCLLNVKPDAKFLFITPEPPESIINKALKKKISSSKIIVVKAFREEVPLYLNLSDISIFFIRAVFSKIASSPTKQAEVMSMGIPMICNSGIGDTDKLIQQTRSGLIVDKFNIASYEKVIDQLDELLKVPKESIREGAIRYLSLESGIKKYLEVYKLVTRL